MATRRHLPDRTDPGHLTRAHGLGEVAAILAAGVVRMRERRRRRADAPTRWPATRETASFGSGAQVRPQYPHLCRDDLFAMAQAE